MSFDFGIMAFLNFENINVTEWTGEECFEWANTVSQEEGIFLHQDVLSTFMAISGNDLLNYTEVEFENLVSSYASIFYWHFQQLMIDRGIGFPSPNESEDYGFSFENVNSSIDEDTSSNIMVNPTEMFGSQPSPSPTHSFSSDTGEEEVANTKCKELPNVNFSDNILTEQNRLSQSKDFMSINKLSEITNGGKIKMKHRTNALIKRQASLEDLSSNNILANISLQNPMNFGDLAHFISGHPIQQNSEQQRAFSSLTEDEETSSDSGVIFAIESDDELFSEDLNSPQPLCIDEDINTEPGPPNVNFSGDVPSEEIHFPLSKDLTSGNTLSVARGRKSKRTHRTKGLPNVNFSDDIPSEEIHFPQSEDLTSGNTLSIARGRKSKRTHRTKGVSSVDSDSKLSILEASSSLSSLQMPFTTGIDVFQRIGTKSRNRDRGPKCWEFLMRLLVDFNSNPSLIKWENRSKHTFRFVEPDEIAKMWGSRMGKHITYVHFARDLRYHYRTGALRDVADKKLVYGCGNEAVRYLHKMYKQHLANEEIS